MQKDLMKYWYYRNRLQYFVVPGYNIGESQIVCVRNMINFTDNFDDPHRYANVTYGQHGVYTGLYIGVLATEFYLLDNNGQYWDAANTYEELYEALYAYMVYWDQQAEQFWLADPDFNGFFIRGNVPCDFLAADNTNGNGHGYTVNGQRHLDLLNKGLSSNDYYDPTQHTFGNLPPGHPGYIDHRTDCEGTTTSPETPRIIDGHPESMSQDEAIFILMGCALTVKMTTDGSTCSNLAKTISDLIIKYITNIENPPGTERFRIYEPSPDNTPGSSIPDAKGGNTYAYGKALLETGRNITGYSYYSTKLNNLNDFWNGDIEWFACKEGISTKHLTATLLAMSNESTLFNFCAPTIYNLTRDNDWDTFYLLLWEVLNHKKRNTGNQNDLLNRTLVQLNAGPCSGPYNYGNNINSGYGGWGATYKWLKTPDEQNGTAEWFYGNYSGTDYMLLYNLYHIVTLANSTNLKYINYNDRYISIKYPVKIGWYEEGTYLYPRKFIGFNSVSSTQIIDTQTSPSPSQAQNPAGNITYIAQSYIDLKDGFHAKAGTLFHAQITDIDCAQPEKSPDENDYPDSTITLLYDSLISIPGSGYPLTVEDDTNAISFIDTLNCPLDTLRFLGITGDTVGDTYSYYWDFGNGQTSTLKTPKVFYLNPGSYKFMLVLTDTNNIKDTVKVIIVVPDCNDSLKSLSDTNHQNYINIDKYNTHTLPYLNIFPNPNNGNMQVNYEISLNTNGVFEIYDPIGRRLYSFPLYGGKNSFSLSELMLPKGVYFYQATAGNKRIAANKFVVIK